jgi:hypothetical protein
MRFVAARGSMSVGESAGGLPPDRVVEDEDAILADTAAADRATTTRPLCHAAGGGRALLAVSVSAAT